jgi:tRNA (guanine-N7-)-methyltransferase
MPRRKMMRYQQTTEKDQVLEPGKPLYDEVKGNWNTQFFKNTNPVTVELGCGGGEYTTGLAMQFPNRNFIGMDVKGDRIWKGALIADSEKLKNVAFLRGPVDFLEKFFAPAEIAEIWIPFPDPRPKLNQEKRRLIHPRYLDMYRVLLQPDGIVHLKTDNRPLFEFALEVLNKGPVKDLLHTFDLYQSDLTRFHFGIQTKYEQHYLKQGVAINYLQFKFK